MTAGSINKYRITINQTGTSASFFRNDVFLTTITTNLPSGASRQCGPNIKSEKLTGAADRDVVVDYFEMRYAFAKNAR